MGTNHSAPMDTILFIHGLWMTPRSWEKWMERYESRGYRVLAPSWPGLEGEVESLRADSAPLTKLDVDKIVNHYDSIIRGLDSLPIIIGHSLGGTITQLLLARDLAAVGVGVAPGTVRGVPDLPLSTPAANRVLAEVAFATLARNKSVTVDFEQDRAPLLSIAYEHDHIIPPRVVRHIVEKYAKSPAITEFKEFKGRPHFPGAPGWEEVAGYALAWATEQAAQRRTGGAARGAPIRTA